MRLQAGLQSGTALELVLHAAHRHDLPTKNQVPKIAGLEHSLGQMLEV